MRKILCGFSAAAIIAFFGTTAFAGDPKPCWAHSEDLAGTNYTAVWTNGGGHEEHEADIFLGVFDTAAACQAAFDAL
jgi:hypothetical protein